jgi:diadenosine tetraphosphate (Ap4A) HIT family hydrolase
VPKINDVIHITDLSLDNQIRLMQEINQTATILQKLFTPTRLNIAMIGNIVSQMHWHIVVRYDTDTAWPSPVWGKQSSVYEHAQENHIINLFQNALLET